MIVAKIYIDGKEIDQIGLINTGHTNEKGEHLYRFSIPADLNHYEIYHKRSDQWYILIAKALEVYRYHNIELLHGEEAKWEVRKR